MSGTLLLVVLTKTGSTVHHADCRHSIAPGGNMQLFNSPHKAVYLCFFTISLKSNLNVCSHWDTTPLGPRLSRRNI